MRTRTGSCVLEEDVLVFGEDFCLNTGDMSVKLHGTDEKTAEDFFLSVLMKTPSVDPVKSVSAG